MMLTVNLASCWQSYRMPSYRGYRLPPEIISHAVWLYHRFALSFRDVEDVLARRGVDVTYEAIRKWCRRFGPEYANTVKLTKSSSIDPQDTGLEPAGKPPCWGSETAVSLNLTIPK